MTHSPLVLGLDLGTSGVKAVLVDESGAVVRQASVELSLSVPRAGWSEQDPADWWSAVAGAIRTLVAGDREIAGRVLGLAVSGQMHGATFLDRLGHALRPAILWNDGRSGAECREITERVGFERLVSLVGNQALAGFTAPKVLWVKKHEPGVFDDTAMVLLPKDYVNFRLTGVRATEPSDASGTLLFDVANQRWSDRLMELLDLSPSLVPTVHPSNSVIGDISPTASEETGLNAGTPVIAGGADNACAALGAGIVDEGQVMVSVGTSGTVLAPSLSPRIEPQARLHCFCHVLDRVWYSMGVVLSAGASLRWYRDTIWCNGQRVSGDGSYDAITAEASTVAPGSEGLIFLPYLSGERTPHGNPDAKGAFVGLSLRHGRAHVSRSVLEGITFALKDSLRLMDDLGMKTTSVIVTGGGARSMFWRQLLADILGVANTAALAEVGPAYGAAILAGQGTGMFSPEQLTARLFARLSEPAEPNLATRAMYDALYDGYRQSYPGLMPVFEALAGVDGQGMD